MATPRDRQRQRALTNYRLKLKRWGITGADADREAYRFAQRLTRIPSRTAPPPVPETPAQMQWCALLLGAAVVLLGATRIEALAPVSCAAPHDQEA